MPETTPQRVLIIKPSALGDVVTALPVLHAARRTWPNAHLAWLLSDACLDLLKDEPDLDEIIPFPRKRLGRCWRSPKAFMELLKFRQTLRNGNFDLVLDLQGLLRSGIFTGWTRAKQRLGFASAREGATLFYTQTVTPHHPHTVMKNIELARQAGLDPQPEEMTLHPSQDALQTAERLLEPIDRQDGFIIAVPPTRWESKTYPIRHWRRVVAELSEQGPVVLLGSPAPEEVACCAAVAEDMNANVLNLAGKSTLPQLAAIISLANLVICGDSAAKFIASAVGTECICLIGPTQPKSTGPFPTGRMIQADIPCRGCLKKRCSHTTCMQSIAPEQIIAEAQAALKGGVTCP